MTKIHSTAIVSKKAQISDDVEIGPYSIIGDHVKIEQGTIVKSHAVIEGDTLIGKNNLIFPFSSIGLQPQDIKFRGENSKLIIGDNNKIREHVTIHLGTQDGGMITKIGSNCLLMVGAHIAHDCLIGDNVIFANNATLAGHVVVENDVVIGGLSAVHQFVRIGQGSMIGGMSGVESDVIPYGLVMGERASLAGLNIVGMKRHNISREEIHSLRNFFKKAFDQASMTSGENFISHINKVSKEFQSTTVNKVLNFITSDSSRSFCKPKSLV